MTQKKKRLAKFVYTGFGFPVVLRAVTMVKTSIGKSAPDVKLNQLESVVFRALATKPAPLVGDEVRFIRHHMSMPLHAFAASFRVSHPAVVKWENARGEPTNMAWGTEVAIRLRILKEARLTPVEFFEAHAEIEALRLDPAERVGIVVETDGPTPSGATYEGSATARSG